MADGYVDKYYEDMKKAAANQRNAQNAILDTDYNAYVQQANQMKANYALESNQAKAGLYQANQLAEQKQANLYADAGLGGAAYQAPKSGVSETARLQQQLNLQNNISAVNAEERKAIKSLNDLILQNKQETATGKLGNESNYWAQMQQYAANAQSQQQTNRNSYFTAVADATSPDDLALLKEFYGINDADAALGKKVWANTYTANGGTLTTEQIADAYGADSEAAKAATAKVQETNYNALNDELAALLAKEGGYSDEEWNAYWTKVASTNISPENKGKLYADNQKRSIAGISSTAGYNNTEDEINALYENKLITKTQQAELLAELAKSEYNPKGFKLGGVSVSPAIEFVRNDGSSVSGRKVQLNQDFKVTLDGKTYWLEFAGNTAVNSDATNNKKYSSYKDKPTNAFFMDNGKLLYKYATKNGGWCVINVGDVNKSAEGQKKADFIEALQAESIK